jgi:N-acyl homoserine lactone hydrolase
VQGPLGFEMKWRSPRDVGYDQKSLRAILLTHSHWDHVSGLPDFPGVPVWVTPQERAFISKGGNGQFGKPFTGIRYEEYGTRYAFVGDLVWQLEGITQREERFWLIRKFADSDAEGNRETSFG